MPVFEKYKRRNKSAFLSQRTEEDRGIGYSRKLDASGAVGLLPKHNRDDVYHGKFRLILQKCQPIEWP